MISYAEMIGDAFIELRGSGFDLSALDTELINEWELMGVPVHLALKVIADVVDYRARKSPLLRVRSLAFVKEEVEARFAELLEGHVGCGGCDQSYCPRRVVRVEESGTNFPKGERLDAVEGRRHVRTEAGAAFLNSR